MAHAPIFDVTVEDWTPGKKKPRAVSATCLTCTTKFRAMASERVAEGAFATYLGAIHLRCPKCKAEGPVQLRRLA